MKRFLAELTGTFVFIFIGCGTVVFAQPWAGYTGIALAYGAALVALMYAFEDVSGAHFNPAVTLGMLIAGFFKESSPLKTAGLFAAYLFAQLAGAFAATESLHRLYFSKAGTVADGTFAATVCTRYPPATAFVFEAVLTAVFVGVFIKTTQNEKTKPFAPLACGLILIAATIVALPVTFAGLNPAKSAAQILFSDDEALRQLPLFTGAAFAGAVAAGVIARLANGKKA